MKEAPADQLSWDTFSQVDMRVGTVVNAKAFEQANRPAYILNIDFGPLGLRKSSAQITSYYEAEALIGQQVIAVVNFPKKQIATIQSECLVLGVVGENNAVTLVQPERPVQNGWRIG
ncbi:tRNA-binding protein [Croceiramulus getboli]|nr:tRNA-binding protein [Flavobacteriaceae bacterium YJPT1-3]